MKLGAILFKQHIGKHFKKHWLVQGKKKILKTNAEQVLTKSGITIVKPEDVLEKTKIEKVEVVGMRPLRIKEDESHPNWHDKVLYTYKDDNVLLEGLHQAQILTKSVRIAEGLPTKYVTNSLTKEINSKVRNIILSAHVFDAEQQKLPKIKDPSRPAWNFPREYGITHERRNKLMTSKLLNLLETREEHDIVRNRFLLNDMYFSFPFTKDDNLIQFQITGDTLLVSQKPLPPVTDESTEEYQLPNLHPIHFTASLNEENIYELENIYPLRKGIKPLHPHTLFIHHDRTMVKNLFEEEVADNQIHGRSLLKTFTVAASYAKQQFGDDVGDLPSPVTVQSVQTDGRLFQFGVLQMNTLNLEDGEKKNIWYQTEQLPLFQVCKYDAGKPVLKGYNDEVVKNLISFYNQC
ncbi:39S ribosomal protein L37, mitochondrial [Coccinella septempunctata]|uniref:39S ribosomal protein L37, mitochondrial n=1 Tax=Coccinella septempunctata TaxID=41139 RepID=UPI001D072822|nr:39S ribosomal protein L37, mitochondrial [Coccinella septempunctata]